MSALTLRHPGGYEFSTERERLDLDTVHGWLSTDSYWAAGRSREIVVDGGECRIAGDAENLPDGEHAQGHSVLAIALPGRGWYTPPGH